jgi:hypothetical protein
MSKNIACSACYGTGYGVDGKPCPCGCRPAATLPAAPAPADPQQAKFDEMARAWAASQDELTRLRGLYAAVTGASADDKFTTPSK